MQTDEEILPQFAISKINDLTKHLKPIVSTDVGQHQMWAAQYFDFSKPNSGYGFKKSDNLRSKNHK